MNYVPLLPGTSAAIPLSRDRQEDHEKGRVVRRVVLATLAFAALSHMVAYRALESIMTAFTSSHFTIVGEDGETTLRGSLIMTGVFFALMVYLMVS